MLQRDKWGGDREITASAEIFCANMNVARAQAHALALLLHQQTHGHLPLEQRPAPPVAPVVLPAQVAVRVYAPSHVNGFSTYNAGPDHAPHVLGAILYHVGGNHWEYLTPNNNGVLAENFALA